MMADWMREAQFSIETRHPNAIASTAKIIRLYSQTPNKFAFIFDSTQIHLLVESFSYLIPDFLNSFDCRTTETEFEWAPRCSCVGILTCVYIKKKN